MVALPYVLGHSHVHIHTHAYSRGVEALVLEPSGPDFLTCGSLFTQQGREGFDICQLIQHFALT